MEHSSRDTVRESQAVFKSVPARRLRRIRKTGAYLAFSRNYNDVSMPGWEEKRGEGRQEASELQKL